MTQPISTVESILDLNLPPLIMFSTPGTPQPYQERFLAALEDGSRLETYSERWVRERNESLKRWNDAIERTADGFRVFRRACSKTLASISPLLLKAMQEQWELERGPTIGRKRRARRARGRRRGNA
jgi:hypothetical protein